MEGSGIGSRDNHVTGSSMRMMGVREIQELIRLNPRTFQIPDEYAVVNKKPITHRTISVSESVPDLPPKRRNHLLRSTVAASSPPPPLKPKPKPKKTVSFDDETKDQPSIQQQNVVPSNQLQNGLMSVQLQSDQTSRQQSASNQRVPHIPVELEDSDVYSLMSNASSGSFRISRGEETIRRQATMPFQDLKVKEDDVTQTADVDVGSVQLRRSLSSSVEKSRDCVDVDIFLTEEDNVLRGVVELSTMHHDVIDKVKMRVVCLFDVSGSMLLKCGRSRQHSKLSKLKKMAADLVDVLEEDDDYVGLVTFGEGSKVVYPLTKVDSSSRGELKTAIQTVDKWIDNKTDLVQGVKRAIQLLHNGPQAQNASYRNAILIFSDGEINSGPTDPDEVVHAVRQSIRDSKPNRNPRGPFPPIRSLNPDHKLWLSIACVTTGGNVSEAMYLVSKYCGNDAYYYVDSDLAHPEVDMLIPLLLRKSSIAQFVTIDILSDNGAKLVTNRCTQEHSVKRRNQDRKSQQMVYYLHDLQAGSQKHFSIAVDLEHYSRESDSEVVSVSLEYVDPSGDTREVKRYIKFSDRLTPLKDPDSYEKWALLSAKSDMRNTFQNSCRGAADAINDDDGDSPSQHLNNGKSKLHDLMEHYGRKAKREETKTKIEEFSRALVDNLDKLIESMEKSIRGPGHKWTKIKSVASAVVRETPTVSKLVAKSETVCPLPVFKTCATTRMTALALKLYRKQEVTSVVFQDQNLFDAAKVVMQSLGDIVNVLNQVETQPRDAKTIRRKIITSMVIQEGDQSD